MTAVLLSVRPRFARALLDGTKTAEVRRRFPSLPSGTTLYIYSTTPDRAVLGTVELDTIDRPPVRDVWDKYQDKIEIDQDTLNHYLMDVESPAILCITNPRPWEQHPSLTALRDRLGLRPPQSFRYLSEAQADVLSRMATGPVGAFCPEAVG